MPTFEQMMSPDGCGGGTESACFALMGIEENQRPYCLIEEGQPEQGDVKLAIRTAVNLKGRLNKDPEGNTICPSDDPRTKKTAEVLSSGAMIMIEGTSS